MRENLLKLLKVALQGLVAPLNRSLFKAGFEFWTYHVCGLALLYFVHLAFSFIFGHQRLWDFNLVATTVWVIGFFLAGLILRRRYIDYDWENQPISTVLVKCVLIGAVISLCIAVMMAVLSLPNFMDEVLRYRRIEEPDISAIGFTFKFIFGNWVQTELYLVAWFALYLGITSGRRAKQAELDNLRLQNSLKEAKLSSLSNQLNPHFLFNALNNIRFMIQENSEDAEGMLMSLSEVLRYSLESSKQEKLPLEKEVAIIHRYIDLVKIQFEDRLRFDMNIPSVLYRCQVPPMILQMLIENAVKHGLERIPGGGQITVDAMEKGEVLQLKVCNDVPDQRTEPKNNTGIGLKNIEQRLNLLYGDAAKMDSGLAKGQFCVTINLPKE